MEQGLKKGFQQGRKQGELLLLMRLLTRQLGCLSSANQDRLLELSLAQIETLSLELFDLKSEADLRHWLATHTA